ncbi:AraC family transcriptional regulator, regulatory protein of adaptative response / methylated-DNA-[protein]-cysteine methyltransferase [Mucilaginibacter sp. OK268]|uniref:AraC family transcriptional regulator n=1 Tax=Mucilaginibacter sp. OK268 TaxID=1881048 RepID=UPI000887D7DC|nr:AraC family transcriptional regulator [Mucilaginibacter sp. OK268]SDP86235.1 AraC family transcriptional regulator, regulatory protein of adaptative response / methylated-DNA-[protein]-cysteine methyltransferase [Mucilaginibacter sp. OK268]
MAKDLTLNYYRIEKAIDYVVTHFKDQPDLDAIAERVNLSLFHFQRLFLDWVGLTPKKFLQYLTVDYLKSKLYETHNVIEAICSGIRCQPIHESGGQYQRNIHSS